jgi:hypothetical protein
MENGADGGAEEVDSPRAAYLFELGPVGGGLSAIELDPFVGGMPDAAVLLLWYGSLASLGGERARGGGELRLDGVTEGGDRARIGERGRPGTPLGSSWRPDLDAYSLGEECLEPVSDSAFVALGGGDLLRQSFTSYGCERSSRRGGDLDLGRYSSLKSDRPGGGEGRRLSRGGEYARRGGLRVYASVCRSRRNVFTCIPPRTTIATRG